MKRISTLILTAVLVFGCLFSTASCAKLDTTGLLEAAPDLIERSAFFNGLFYGDGIPYSATDEEAIGNYYPASPAFLDEHGFHTVKELKEKTKEVFSQNYCESIFSSSVFSGYSSGVGTPIYARYSSNKAVNDPDEEKAETILVSSVYEPLLACQTVYDFSTLTVSEVGKDYATVSLAIELVYKPTEEKPSGERRESTLSVRFVYEDGWRIDSATY